MLLELRRVTAMLPVTPCRQGACQQQACAQVFFVGSEAKVDMRPSSVWLKEKTSKWPWKTHLKARALCSKVHCKRAGARQPSKQCRPELQCCCLCMSAETILCAMQSF